MAQRNTQSVQDVDPKEEAAPPEYVVHLGTAEANARSLPALIADRMCYMCRQGEEGPPDDSADVGEYLDRIVGHCAEGDDFLLPDTPLKEAIFRVILSRGNEPVTAETVSEILSQKWSLTPYPRDVSPRVVRRLMENSESYCIARLPDPEPEEEAEEEAE